MKPRASIIIPTWNEEKNLGRCLSAVFSQTVDFVFEVVIVDSGSTDGTREIAEQFARKYPLKWLELKPGQFSHGRARQFGSEKASGEYLIYLVADAIPANNQWLKKLVESAEKDERVAGVYSRQIPYPDADFFARIRAKKRKVSRKSREETELKNPDDYWLMNPLEKIAFCDFDDVSSLRKKSVLDKIPIPDCPWAEDLVWSKQCLLQGYKIVYEPESLVYHSHQTRLFYLLRRGWLDQKSAEEYFGQVYYPDLKSAFQGFFFSIKELRQEIFSEPAKFQEKIFSLLKSPFLCALEILGRYLAGIRREENSGYDLMKQFKQARILPREVQSRVAQTSFSIGEQWRRVILAHPFVIINYWMRIAENSELRFGIGVRPEAFKLRTAPIDFMVAINQEPIFRFQYKMVSENLRGWREFALDLGPWADQEVCLSLITASKEINSAWAGWAEPKILVRNNKNTFKFKNFLLTMAEKMIAQKRFRHP